MVAIANSEQEGQSLRSETNGEPERRSIPTLVKDSSLVEKKRAKIVEASVDLFVRHGFHDTTTRQIARAAGISVGSLYEYVGSKEDILYLVCDSIHTQMESALHAAIDEGKPILDRVEGAVAAYLRVCDRMQDSILLIYRETAVLDSESQVFVLKSEERITKVFGNLLSQGRRSGVFLIDEDVGLRLMAHNIVVLGHMWAFRRWYLRDEFSIESYIAHQTTLIMRELTAG